METRTHQIISGILALLFLSFAVVQVNDPDPAIWITIYALSAGFCVWNIFRKVPSALSFAAVIACAVFAVLLWPEEYQGLAGKMDSRPGVEYARESLGLVICGVGMIYVGWRGLRKR
jgi:hypothetical protein